MVVFGGCLDLSGFLSLNKNYVQSRDTWVLQLDSLTCVISHCLGVCLMAAPCFALSTSAVYGCRACMHVHTDTAAGK